MAGADTSADRLIAGYLDRLARAAVRLPAGVRDELYDDIRTHLVEVAGTTPDEATLRQVLDELGSPEEIVAAAAAESGTEPGAGTGTRARTGGELGYDVAAVLVLLLGGFVVPVLGWIAGVVMLWSGPRWAPRHKWIGTLLWPAAIVVEGAALLAAHQGMAPAVVVLLGLALVVAGLLIGFAYLLRAAARPRT